MAEEITCSEADSFVVEGRLALPYQYFAGRTGSRFIVGLRDEKKIRATRCPECGKVYLPPRSTCERHLTTTCSEWVEVGPGGEVTGFTVVRYSEPYQPVPPPYVLALIRLDNADTPFVHLVRNVAPSEMRVGMRVRAVFAKETTNTILDIAHFEPDGKPAFELGRSYDELELGMSATFSKTITETDVYLFAGISGDFNPMHTNEEFAKTTPFGTRIAHGALAQSLLAPVLGMKLPGLGTVALEVTVRFKAPTRFGDTITARATVAEKLEKRKWVRMECLWTNQNGETVATGSALVMPPQK